MATTPSKCTACKGKGKVESLCPRCGGSGRRREEDFYTKRLKNWKEIYQCRKDLEGRGWIFRGQSDFRKPLKTSLEQVCPDFPEDLRDPKEAELRLCREFRRRFHQYSVHTPEKHDYLEWFSLMQHYGAPTRLLDFTYSIFIAAYFALENARDDCAVWAINAVWALKESLRNLRRELKLPKNSTLLEFLTKYMTEENWKNFEKVFMSKRRIQFTCGINPFKMSERLTIQKGVFMCPGDVTCSFEENLCALEDYDKKENIRKFIIPREQRAPALDDLYDLNITRATLFPGLDGFASSLRLSPPKTPIPPSVKKHYTKRD